MSRDTPGKAETVFVVIALFLFTGAVIFSLRSQYGGGPVDEGSGDPLLQAVWLSIDGIVVFLLLRRWRQTLAAMWAVSPIWLLVGLAVISPLWSSAPQLTTRRSIALVGTTLFGVYFASRYSLHRQVHLLAWALGLAVLSSLIFVFAQPSLGIDAGGDWQGSFITKNVMGRALTLSVIVFLLCSWKGPRRKLVLGMVTMIATFLLVGAGSSTALVVLPLAVASLFSARVLRWPAGLSIPLVVMMLAISSAAAIWTSDNFGEALGAVGRDTTLTGRTQLWADVIVQIEDKPWLGYGYAGFWRGWNGPSAAIWNELYWQPPHAHNGLLDLWLDLGAIGVAVFVAGLAIVFVHALKLARRARDRSDLLPIAFLVFMVLYNLSESTILRQNSIFWMLYVAVATSVLSRAPSTAHSPQERTVARVPIFPWSVEANLAPMQVESGDRSSPARSASLSRKNGRRREPRRRQREVRRVIRAIAAGRFQ